MNLMIMGKEAKLASEILAITETSRKNETLCHTAELLEREFESVLAANAIDVANAEQKGVSPAMVDRLRLDQKRVYAMANGLRSVAKLPDPVGEVLEEFTRPNGIAISKVRVPFGVIGIIYESRPNVTADAFGLCFKTGNAVILRGGSDAIHSNTRIAELLRQGVRECGLPENSISLITDTSRETVNEFMRLNRFVDVLIPRGGAGLIQNVIENSLIPVIETGTGNCHVYVDESADFDMALKIILNAKTQRMGVCNACESLVIHEKIAESFLPKLYEMLSEKNVVMRADEEARGYVPAMEAATEEDFAKEYLGSLISIKTVSSVSEAIQHINHYHTRHSDAIVTNDAANAEQFLKQIDSACVYVNASTRFTDGEEFGFGAEIGISTQKLHARGPMGLRELTSYKYLIRGEGQVRG
ncbi:MAG: glutamate-5-semialdehyde dehydrogenase [Lachnospiraceae bacterium]|nr:glutamate-5-semialdehyde dehydrogenase [Lachnospiraceae bacterium]